MKKKFLVAAFLGSTLMLSALECQAVDWVKNNVDIPNKNVEANYYDGDSVKVKNKALCWTEKFTLTDFGAQAYTKHLKESPTCKTMIDAHGPATYHQMDFEIKKGQYRVVGKRAYNKDNQVICTDKEMPEKMDSSWHDMGQHSPMSERYYIFVTKYKIGDL